MMILLQLFMNIGMVIGLLPVVGITLPLMSYGGSSILITLFSLGLVYNIALQK
jgi:cell division protein FtsW (lipid II flippase)